MALKSISDDDLCSQCWHCRYNPGALSRCKSDDGSDWPGIPDADGYVQNCESFSQIKVQGENLVQEGEA